jgi:hypothetical protein
MEPFSLNECARRLGAAAAALGCCIKLRDSTYVRFVEPNYDFAQYDLGCWDTH